VLTVSSLGADSSTVEITGTAQRLDGEEDVTSPRPMPHRATGPSAAAARAATAGADQRLHVDQLDELHRHREHADLYDADRQDDATITVNLAFKPSTSGGPTAAGRSR
jgi:hypothetical protein